MDSTNGKTHQELIMNLNALTLWALGAIVGYLINGVDGLLVGLALTLSISLIASVIAFFILD